VYIFVLKFLVEQTLVMVWGLNPIVSQRLEVDVHGYPEV
jgi:hypothetical protein